MSHITTKPTKWCVPSDDSDQPGHTSSLIRAFVVSLKKVWVLWRFWSDWMDLGVAQIILYVSLHYVQYRSLQIKRCWSDIDNLESCQFSVNLSYSHHMSPAKRICVFEHSVMTKFNCACPAIQRGQGSGFLSEGSSWFTACISEQRRFWRDCADAQACLNLRCSHRR